MTHKLDKKSFTIGHSKRKLEEDVKKLRVQQKNFYIKSNNIAREDIGLPKSQDVLFNLESEFQWEKITQGNVDDVELHLSNVKSEIIDLYQTFNELLLNEYLKK